MKVILYMAMTVNAYVARKNDETPWSDEVWAAYSDFVKKVGNIVVGRRTYEIMRNEDDFKNLGFPETVVLTHHPSMPADRKTTFVTSPEEAIRVLQEKGFKEMAVGGGSRANASFMKAGLIDELILDIEPLIFGRGIPLLSEDDFEATLELLKTEKLSEKVLRLHYKVLK